MILLNVFPFLSGICFAFIPLAAVKYSLSGIFALLTLCVTIYIHRCCPEATTTRFALEGDGYSIGEARFRTPLVPYLPALAIFANWFMLASVGWQGIVMLVVYLILGVVMYGGFCSGRSLTSEYESNGCSYNNNNLLPGRISPTDNSSVSSPLQEALLPGGEWEHQTNNRLMRDLSQIETNKKVRFV